MKRPYQVIRIDHVEEEGPYGEEVDVTIHSVLASYATYDTAYKGLDYWSNRFPHAYIDIHNKNETND